MTGIWDVMNNKHTDMRDAVYAAIAALYTF